MEPILKPGLTEEDAARTADNYSELLTAYKLKLILWWLEDVNTQT